MPKKKACKILEEWICRCRKRNTSNRIELKDVSNWAEKRLEINDNCPDINSIDGSFFFFCLGSLLSFGGGNYRGRVAELRNSCQGASAHERWEAKAS